MPATSQPFYWAAEDGWYLWVKDTAGKRKRIFLAKTKRSAWIIWKDRLARSKPDEADPKFSVVGKQWLERQTTRCERGEVSTTWLARVTRTIVKFGEAHPAIRCSGVTPSIATGWFTRTVSVAYEHTEVSTLKQVLKWAVQQKLIDKSPLESMRLSKGSRREGVLSLDQHRKLISDAKPDLRAILWFAWFTGCRPSELRHLQWGHITKDCTQAVLVSHKNARSTGRHRIIFFPPNARAILKRNRRKSGYVFVNTLGQPWTKDALVCRLRRLRKNCDLDATAYTYRHSYATRALEQGVSPADLAEILGTSVEVISRNYSHLDQSKKRLAEIAARVR